MAAARACFDMSSDDDEVEYVPPTSLTAGGLSPHATAGVSSGHAEVSVVPPVVLSALAVPSASAVVSSSASALPSASCRLMAASSGSSDLCLSVDSWGYVEVPWSQCACFKEPVLRGIRLQMYFASVWDCTLAVVLNCGADLLPVAVLQQQGLICEFLFQTISRRQRGNLLSMAASTAKSSKSLCPHEQRAFACFAVRPG